MIQFDAYFFQMGWFKHQLGLRKYVCEYLLPAVFGRQKLAVALFEAENYCNLRL